MLFRQTKEKCHDKVNKGMHSLEYKYISKK